MGIFDLFSKKDGASSQDKELARLQKMISNKLSQNADREDALYRLADMKTPAAARVLLVRFTWKLDPSIKDQEEKEVAVRGIVAAGEGAIEPIRKHCVRAEGLVWPLKALKGILSVEALEAELLSLLDEFDTDYMRNPEPKVQLVQALGEYKSEDVRIAVQPFLTDMSEDVRFAAVTTVLGCGSSDAVESLVEAMADEESLRVKNRIAAGLVDQAWDIPEAVKEKLSQVAPTGFSVQGARLTGSAAH